MFNTKIYFALGVIFLLGVVSAQTSSDTECDGCLGDDLVKLVDTLVEKKQCWFNNKHHYLITFKVRMMSTITEHLLVLYEKINGMVSENCKRNIELKQCGSIIDDRDERAQCYVDNSQTLVYNYRDQEKCHKQILLPAQTTLMYRLLSGVIAGWNEIHTTC